MWLRSSTANGSRDSCWKPYHYFHLRTFQTSFHSATSTCSSMGLEGFRVDLCPPSSSNGRWTTGQHFQLPLRGSRGRQSHIAMSCQPTLLVGYTQAYLKRLEHWLRNWRIAISVPTSTTVFFVEVARVSQKPWYAQLFGEPIQSIESGIFCDQLAFRLERL